MLKRSLAVTTTQLERRGVKMDVSIIFNAGDLVTNGVFFPSKRLGHAVFKGLTDKGITELDKADLIGRKARYTFESIVDLIDSIIDSKEPYQILLRTGLKPNNPDVSYGIYKLYFVEKREICEGYYVNAINGEAKDGYFCLFRRDAIARFNELCGSNVAENVVD